jgi:hypothetical protein
MNTATAIFSPAPAPMRRFAAKVSAKLREAPPWHKPSLAALQTELKRFADKRGPAQLWWRDDDAIAATPALDQLLAARAEFDVPLCLAVIPAQTSSDLAARLRDETSVRVVQHGWNHQDHAAPGAHSCELGDDRPRQSVITELHQGWAKLAQLFGTKVAPILAPPFNTIGRDVARAARIGWSAISVSGDMPGIPAPTINVHLDLIDWKTNAPASDEAMIGAALRALWLRRVGLVAPTAPIGIMTHHLVHSPAIWDATRHWLNFFRASPEVRFAALSC